MLVLTSLDPGVDLAGDYGAVLQANRLQRWEEGSRKSASLLSLKQVRFKKKGQFPGRVRDRKLDCSSPENVVKGAPTLGC